MPTTVPASLLVVLEVLRSCFTAPTYQTLSWLVTGVLSTGGPRTVTGMWSAAGLAGHRHWSRAHRFFSRAVWDADQVGLALAGAVVARFVPGGGDLTVAVDDTLFLRCGKKVFGAVWQHDGSARGRDGIGRGNCFVVAGLVVTLPFMNRQVCLPVLLRLHVPKAGKSKTEQAREMADLLVAAFPGRRVHVVGDALYRGPAWRDLPAHVTFTTRLASNAVPYGPQPPRTGKRGHPRWKGDKLGTPADLAATARWRTVTLNLYGDTKTVQVYEVVCLWWGSLHRTPVKVVLMREADSPRAYDWALVTTDTAATGEEVIVRYGSRWSIEQANKDGKGLLGAGDAQNRTRTAVERTVPFTMLCLTIATLWYDHTGHMATDLATRRTLAPWYRHKTHISMIDILAAFRRTRITTITADQASPHQIPPTPATRQPTAA
jgi:transposase